MIGGRQIGGRILTSFSFSIVRGIFSGSILLKIRQDSFGRSARTFGPFASTSRVEDAFLDNVCIVREMRMPRGADTRVSSWTSRIHFPQSSAGRVFSGVLCSL